ncbi:MAG TPA: hypothetical protein VH835_10815, partial [Dongiaceae bacterium]
WDRMRNWDHHNHVAIGQFYFVSVGPERNYRVYGGLQDNSSWGGPSRVRNANGPGNTDWFQLGGGDGFLAMADPNDKDQIYYESQNGAMGRINLRTGEGGSIRPQPQQGQTFRFNWKTPFMLSPHNSTIFYSAGNYVFRSIFKGSNMRPISPEITTTEQGAGSAITESPLEEGVLYVGTTDGNVWVTRNGGAEWVNVFDDPDRVAAPARGGRRGRGARGGRGRRGGAEGQRGEATGARGEGGTQPAAAEGEAAAEQTQPAQRPAEDTQVGRGGAGGGTAAGGATPPTEPAGGQQEVREQQQTGQPAGQQPIAERQVAQIAAAAQGDQSGAKFLRDLVPGKRWVSSIHASKFAAGRCYVTLDGHRSNDDEPYLFVTEDYGRTWRSIRANLPTSAGTTHVLREDLVNQDVLYLGCEFSAWVSIDRGKSWTKFNNNLPTVAIHEFAIHPTANEIVAATHGRSLWIADITHLRQLSAATLAANAHLYKPNNAVRWRREPSRGSAGTRAFSGESAPNGARIYYSLGRDAQSVELTISNLLGETFYRTTGETSAGLHSVTWNLARQGFGPAAQGGGRRGGGRAGRGGAGPRGGEAGERGGEGARGAATAARGGGGGGRGGRGG